ncbi:MAG: hypothetical protein PHC51_11110 [bacterium]|nr:hypothetical protein [bacterium]
MSISIGGSNVNRANLSVLVVHSNSMIMNQIRQSLKTLGFMKITSCPSHMAGLDRIKTRTFPVIFMEAKATDMPVIEFVCKVLEMDGESAMIAITAQPKIDDVFGFLKHGGKGFLVCPFTADIVEETLVRAKEGPPISEAVLSAPDRNTAFSGVILNNLYRNAVLMRQVREFPNLQKELARSFKQFSESCEMGKIFCEGGENFLREKIMETCIARANVASTRLGRTRKKLMKKRLNEAGEEVDDYED